jgi:hypothetical protein
MWRTELLSRPTPASRVRPLPIREGPWHNTNFAGPGRRRDPKLDLDPSSRVHRWDSYNPELHSLRKNRQLYLSLVPYPQDLFYLHLA